MRLTLRTLLAHEHGLLNEAQAALISQKIEQSPFVSQLLRHLRDRMRRREIVPFSIETRGHAALATVVRYLDHELPADSVVALENECFGSDRLLAEVAACHEILAQWLSKPTPLEPALRQRLYEVVPSPDRLESKALGTSAPWAMLPSAVSVSAPAPEQPNFEQANSEQASPAPAAAAPSRRRGTRRRTLVAGFSLAASVAVMVTLGTQYRAQFQGMLEQHVRSQVAQAATTPPTATLTATPTAAPTATPTKLPTEPMARPESFVVGTTTLEPLDRPHRTAPEEVGSATDDPQVATTAFHLPLENRTAAQPTAAQPTPDELSSGERGNDLGKIGSVWAGIVVPGGDISAMFLAQGSAPLSPRAGTRVIVPSPGSCNVADDGRLKAVGPAEVRWDTEQELTLRYGQMMWSGGDRETPGGGRETVAWNVAGQSIRLEAASADAQLRLTTAPVALDGVNYAQDTANQEVWIECLAGTVRLALSSCQGPLSLQQGDIVAAHRTAGVRSEEAAQARQLLERHRNSRPAAEERFTVLRPDGSLIANLRQLAQAEATSQSLPAREVLAQLDHWEELIAGWSREIPPDQFAAHAAQLRQILAQDQELASRLEAHLTEAYPEHGSLVFRLICGFSADQRSEVTLDQLRSLTQHPANGVRQWAAYQLAHDSNFARATE